MKRQGPGHQGPESTESRRQRGRKTKGEKRKKTEGKGKKKQTKTGQPQPGGGRANEESNENSPRTDEAHPNAPSKATHQTRRRRPRTRTHARDPGVASLDLRGEVSASTRNSPGAPDEDPVERRTARETGRGSDRVHTRQTTAANAARDRRRRDPPGTTSQRGPERV